jgi:hypothetical protein
VTFFLLSNLGNRNTVQVIVVLLDVNDHAPQLPAPALDAYITENSLRKEQKLSRDGSILDRMLLYFCVCLLTCSEAVK